MNDLLDELYSIMKNPPPLSAWSRFKKKLIAKNPRQCWRWAGKHERQARKYQYGLFKYHFPEAPTRNIWWVQRCWGRWIYGDLVDGLVMDHRVCSHPPCCNPYHLMPCTQWENLTRLGARTRMALNLHASHCDLGHEFTKQNTRVRDTGWRECITCKDGIDVAYYQWQDSNLEELLCLSIAMRQQNESAKARRFRDCEYSDVHSAGSCTAAEYFGADYVRNSSRGSYRNFTAQKTSHDLTPTALGFRQQGSSKMIRERLEKLANTS